MLTWQEFLESKTLPKDIEAAREKPGGSNVGKERKTSGAEEGPFCGSVKGSFPVTNPKQWRAAKSYARHDADPEKVKKCADNVAKKRGWA